MGEIQIMTSGSVSHFICGIPENPRQTPQQEPNHSCITSYKT